MNHFKGESIMKTTAKIILVIFTLALTLSICSCTNIGTITRDIGRAVEIGETISALAKMPDKSAAMEEAEKLIHPKSGLDKEAIVNQIKENEAIKALNIEDLSTASVSVGEFSTPEFKFNNEELGGNVYSVNVVITVAGVPLNANILLLSDETVMGLYSFDIENAK